MSTKSKNTAASLSATELAQVKERVERVASLVRKSATVWLDVAKEFGDADAKLSQIAYEKFCNEAGFTHSVADKLTLISKCKPLYDSKYEDVVSRVDGWSTFYELKKLHDEKKLDQLRKYVEQHPDTSVTRSVVANVKSGNAPTDKTLVLARITVQDSKFKLLSQSEKNNLAAALSQAKALLATAASCVEFAFVGKSIIDELGGKAPQLSTSAHALAHVHDSEIARLEPKILTESEKSQLNETAFQFSIFQHNVRVQEAATELRELKSQSKPSADEKKRLKRLEAYVASNTKTKMPYDPKSQQSIEHPDHPFSVCSKNAEPWNHDRFCSYLRENNILLESDGIPDRPEYAQVWCASLGASALKGTPAEKSTSIKALKDIVASENRVKVRGNISKAPIARSVLAQINNAVSQ